PPRSDLCERCIDRLNPIQKNAICYINSLESIPRSRSSRRRERALSFDASRRRSRPMNVKPPRATWLVSICALGIASCGDRHAPQTESESAELAALAPRVDAAAALTERLKAVRAVKRLQHAYGHYSEVGLWHDFADL